jgi:hypothetical protein
MNCHSGSISEIISFLKLWLKACVGALVQCPEKVERCLKKNEERSQKSKKHFQKDEF